MVFAHALVQMCTHGMGTIVFVQSRVLRNRIDQAQPGLYTFDHRSRNRMVQCDHRIVTDAQKQPVEVLNLRPIGLLWCLGFIVNRRDGGLQLIRAPGLPGR